MAYTNINEGKRPVDMNDPRVIPTETVERDLRDRFPDLEFPYIKQDHVAGVRSNVHAYCEKHQMFSRMLLSSARTVGGTKYGCWACADEHKGGSGGGEHGHSPRRYAPGYIGRSGVQSGIFRAVKAVYPDAVWEHRMENGKEIDIFIPTLGFGIEYNGNYYHSSAVGKASDYHVRKTLGGIKENKSILHIFTDEVGHDFTKFASYVKEVMRLYNIVNHLDANPADKQRMRFDPYKARQLSVAEGRAFVLTHSITYMSEAVLNAFGLFIGVYDQHKSLVAVLYGKPGAIYGVAMADTFFNLTVGLHRYSQHAKTLKYYAPLRDPMACLLQRLHTQQLGFDVHSNLTPDDLYGGRVEVTSPVGYGLTKATTIVPSVEGCAHTIYDCGWVSVKLK